MDDVIISAPGKVIIHGEHAVVYGKAALVGCLQKRSWIRIGNSVENNITLDLHSLKLHKTWTKESIETIRLAYDETKPKETLPKDHNSVVAFLNIYLTLANKLGECIPMKVTVKSEIPIGAGLGSSASYSVCISAALLCKFGQISIDLSDKKSINDYAFECEKIFHGNPSGADNTTCCYGGIQLFNNSDTHTQTTKEAGSASATSHDALPPVEICLVNTNVQRALSTSRIIDQVREQYDSAPDVFGHLFNAIHAMALKSYQFLSEIETSDCYEELGRLLDYNQHILESLEVSHSKIGEVCSVFRLHGIKAKLTGAGCGGCCFAFVHPDYHNIWPEKLQHCLSSLEAVGAEASLVKLGGAGVLSHDVSEWLEDE